MVRLPVKKTTRLLEGESRSKVVGCNNTSFLFAKLQKTGKIRKQFKEKMKFFSFFFFLFRKLCIFATCFERSIRHDCSNSPVESPPHKEKREQAQSTFGAHA